MRNRKLLQFFACLAIIGCLASCSSGDGDDTAVAAPTVVKIAAGESHTVALQSDGTLWAWGDNSYGQLGNGHSSSIAVKEPAQVGSDTDWSSMACGAHFTVAIKTDGTLWAWGDNECGQLGTGDTETSETNPVRIGSDTTWSAVACGTYHTVALKGDGTLWTWGEDAYGELGNGDSNSDTVAKPMLATTTTGWSAIACGNNHCLAILDDGTLWAWGLNTTGQLGTGDYDTETSPVKIGSMSTWKKIACGGFHSLAIASAALLPTFRPLYAWGNGANGQLGTGYPYSDNSPTKIGDDLNWSAIAGGVYHTIALQSDGTLWTWGYDFYGQLGNGDSSSDDVTTPAQVGSDADWSAVASGYEHCLALKGDGTLWAWGQNSDGQLGTGDTTNRTSPVQITLGD